MDGLSEQGQLKKGNYGENYRLQVISLTTGIYSQLFQLLTIPRVLAQTPKTYFRAAGNFNFNNSRVLQDVTAGITRTVNGFLYIVASN